MKKKDMGEMCNLWREQEIPPNLLLKMFTGRSPGIPGCGDEGTRKFNLEQST
jgi:hypothetical protein